MPKKRFYAPKTNKKKNGKKAQELSALDSNKSSLSMEEALALHDETNPINTGTIENDFNVVEKTEYEVLDTKQEAEEIESKPNSNKPEKDNSKNNPNSQNSAMKTQIPLPTSTQSNINQKDVLKVNKPETKNKALRPFEMISETSSRIVGSPVWFAFSLSIIIVWFTWGVIAGFTDTWHASIHTITSVITLLIMALLQSSQTKWEKRMYRLEDHQDKVLHTLKEETDEIKVELERKMIEQKESIEKISFTNTADDNLKSYESNDIEMETEDTSDEEYNFSEGSNDEEFDDFEGERYPDEEINNDTEEDDFGEENNDNLDVEEYDGESAPEPALMSNEKNKEKALENIPRDTITSLF